MDIDDNKLRRTISYLTKATETRVRYYNNQTGEDLELDEKGLLSREEEIARFTSLKKPPQKYRSNASKTHPLLMITAEGDVDTQTIIQVTSSSFYCLFKAMRMPLQTLPTIKVHIPSAPLYFIDFDPTTHRPVAISFLFCFRPVITAFLRFSFTDFSLAACIWGVSTSDVNKIASTLKKRVLLDESYLPLSLFVVPLEVHLRNPDKTISSRMFQLESRVGMIPNYWRNTVEPGGPETYSDILRQIQALSPVISTREARATASCRSITLYKSLSSEIDDIKSDMGFNTTPSHINRLQKNTLQNMGVIADQQLSYVLKHKFRHSTLANTIFSLIAQRDSKMQYQSAEDSREIARIAAQDSQAMKTITIITLVFLPSTFLASIWDAGIFSIEGDANWKAFVGTSFGTTLFVFTLWILYLRFSRDRHAGILGKRESPGPEALSPDPGDAESV